MWATRLLPKQIGIANGPKKRWCCLGPPPLNYMTMASLEQAAEWARQEGKEAFRKVVKHMEPLWQLCNEKHLPLPLGPRDKSRLSFLYSASGTYRGTGRPAIAL